MGILSDDQFNLLWEAVQPGDQTGHRVKRLERKPSRAEIGGAVEAVPSLPTASVKGRIVFLESDQRLYYDTGTVWIPLLGKMIGARAVVQTAQTIPNAQTTVVVFDEVTYDPFGAIHQATPGDTDWYFTAPIDGYYHVFAKVSLAANPNWLDLENYSISLFLNGVNYSVLDFDNNFPASANASGQGGDDIYLSQGDAIDIRVLQNSGGANNTLGNGLHNHVSIHWIGA